MINVPAFDAVLRSSRLFHAMAPERGDRFAADFEAIFVAGGGIVVSEGDADAGLFVVGSGVIHVSKHSPERRLITSVLGPADQFGDVALFDRGPSDATVQASTDALLFCIDRSRLADWLDDAQITDNLFASLCRQLRRAHSTSSDLVVRSFPERVAKRTLQLPRKFSEPGDRLLRYPADLLSPDEFADFVGGPRSEVDAALRSFAEHRWIKTENDVVLIEDRNSLFSFAQGFGVP